MPRGRRRKVEETHLSSDCFAHPTGKDSECFSKIFSKCVLSASQVSLASHLAPSQAGFAVPGRSRSVSPRVVSRSRWRSGRPGLERRCPGVSDGAACAFDLQVGRPGRSCA